LYGIVLTSLYSKYPKELLKQASSNYEEDGTDQPRDPFYVVAYHWNVFGLLLHSTQLIIDSGNVITLSA